MRRLLNLKRKIEAIKKNGTNVLPKRLRRNIPPRGGPPSITRNFGCSEVTINKTITVYVQMDALEQNTTHWIKWRNTPSEGWKINSLSFDGNIESLAAPLSPEK
jgi:hypothetical protein